MGTCLSLSVLGQIWVRSEQSAQVRGNKSTTQTRLSDLLQYLAFAVESLGVLRVQPQRLHGVLQRWLRLVQAQAYGGQVAGQ